VKSSGQCRTGRQAAALASASFLIVLATARPQAPTSPSAVLPQTSDCVIYGNGISVRLNDGHMETTHDKTHWTNCAMPVATFLRGLAYGNGLFVAVGGSYVQTPGVILTSVNGTNWIRRNVRNKINLNAVATGKGLFVAVGDAGVIFTSADGAAWKAQPSGTDSMLAAIAFGKGVFVASGESGAILRSTNGVHWTGQSVGPSIYLGRIRFKDGEFLAVGCSATFASTDGLTWRREDRERAARSAAATTNSVQAKE
jgi:hypothetical protein